MKRIPIDNIEYYADENGNIYNKRGRKLKGHNLNGYIQIGLSPNRKMFLIHRLIALTFIPNPLNLPEVNHKNGLKIDNSVDNLEWCTSKYNMKHASENGLLKPVKGIKHYMVKLTEEQIIEIRQLYSSGNYTQKELGTLFNVSTTYILRIVNYHIWKSI